MKMLVFLFSGPILMSIGYFGSYGLVFWIGTAICAFILFMNLASGVLKFPIIPLIMVGISTMFIDPWFVAAAIGLGAWTALEAVGEVYGRLSETRNNR